MKNVIAFLSDDKSIGSLSHTQTGNCREHNRGDSAAKRLRGEQLRAQARPRREPGFPPRLWLAPAPNPARPEQSPLDIFVNVSSLLLLADTGILERPGWAAPGTQQAACLGLCGPRVCSWDEVQPRQTLWRRTGKTPHPRLTWSQIQITGNFLWASGGHLSRTAITVHGGGLRRAHDLLTPLGSCSPSSLPTVQGPGRALGSPCPAMAEPSVLHLASLIQAWESQGRENPPRAGQCPGPLVTPAPRRTLG